jgi:hypothetical protein
VCIAERHSAHGSGAWGCGTDSPVVLGSTAKRGKRSAAAIARRQEVVQERNVYDSEHPIKRKPWALQQVAGGSTGSAGRGHADADEPHDGCHAADGRLSNGGRSRSRSFRTRRAYVSGGGRDEVLRRLSGYEGNPSEAKTTSGPAGASR